MYLKLAWRNIWRNRKRTWITASSIGFAVFFACVMQSMQLGTYELMIDNTVRFYTGHLGIHQEGYWEEKILDNSFEGGNQVPVTNENITVMVPRLTSFALSSFGDRTRGVMVNGIDPERESVLTALDKKIVKGRYLTDRGSLIAEGLASYLKLQVGDTLVMISQGYHGVNAAGKFPVVGIVKFPVPELNQQSVYLTLDEARSFYGAEGLLTSYSILLDDPSVTRQVQKEVEKQLAGTGLRVMDWKTMMPELVQSIELDYYGGLIMIYILYAVIAFGIFGTFIMMTKERTYEFGILVSIGMKKRKIQAMVAIEVFLLSLFGVLLGVVASFPLNLYFYLNPIRLTGNLAEAYEKFGFEPVMPFSMDPVIYYDQGLVILFIALVLGVYPMLSIMRLNSVKALKE